MPSYNAVVRSSCHIEGNILGCSLVMVSKMGNTRHRAGGEQLHTRYQYQYLRENVSGRTFHELHAVFPLPPGWHSLVLERFCAGLDQVPKL